MMGSDDARSQMMGSDGGRSEMFGFLVDYGIHQESKTSCGARLDVKKYGFLVASWKLSGR